MHSTVKLKNVYMTIISLDDNCLRHDIRPRIFHKIP